MFIKDFREGDMVNGIYFVKSKQTLQTKQGKNYFSMILQDSTGQIDAKIWDLTSGISHFDANDFISITAQVTVFQGNNQLNIRQVRKAQEGEYRPEDYMPCTKKDVAAMYDELLALISSVKSPFYKKLLESFFVEDKSFIETFKAHSAAKSIHHGFIGGLLEHTLSVAKICDFYSTIYPIINRDLLLTAAICHDIGKVEEMSLFPENDYTDEGQLIGHIVRGAMMVEQKAAAIEGFPKVKSDELVHCILAHHGELEYGSPKKPALIEAVALSFADNTDAKIETFTEALESVDTLEWQGFNRALESNVRATSKPE